jgi:hypothetical protein
MTVHLNHRGWVAVILSAALGVVLIVLVVAVALGVQVSEVGRSAAWALAGGLAGALIAYLTGTSGNGGTQPPSAPK